MQTLHPVAHRRQHALDQVVAAERHAQAKVSVVQPLAAHRSHRQRLIAQRHTSEQGLNLPVIDRMPGPELIHLLDQLAG